MITATRKRETKLRSVKGLSNYGVMIVPFYRTSPIEVLIPVTKTTERLL
jgi:hypothetical protein